MTTRTDKASLKTHHASDGVSVPLVSALTGVDRITSGDDASTGFKLAMRRQASTITIVSTVCEGKRYGMAATAVTSVSTSPPSLLICVNRSASIHQVLVEGTRYCINLLSCDHVDLVPLFSGKLTGEDRFTVGSWSATSEGVPYLADAQANIFCTVDQKIDYGSHAIFVGRVDHSVIANDTPPLVYYDGALFGILPINS